MAVSIEITEISKKLGSNQALKKVSLKFEEGLMHGVIGPEGAGKTTLFRHIVGLLTPSHGDLKYFRNNSPEKFSVLRPSIAYMPQQQSLYADLSIEEHLLFFKKLYGLSDEEFEIKSNNLLKITRLDKFKSRSAGKLSGGMYKKLGLMCSLLASPSVLLLDEPTNGVDPISRREFWELLYGLKEEKILILIATAYMDEAERCARVHLLNSGEVIGTGEPKKLLTQYNAKNFDEYFLKIAGSRHE